MSFCICKVLSGQELVVEKPLAKLSNSHLVSARRLFSILTFSMMMLFAVPQVFGQEEASTASELVVEDSAQEDNELVLRALDDVSFWGTVVSVIPGGIALAIFITLKLLVAKELKTLNVPKKEFDELMEYFEINAGKKKLSQSIQRQLSSKDKNIVQDLLKLLVEPSFSTQSAAVRQRRYENKVNKELDGLEKKLGWMMHVGDNAPVVGFMGTLLGAIVNLGQSQVASMFSGLPQDKVIEVLSRMPVSTNGGMVIGVVSSLVMISLGLVFSAIAKNDDSKYKDITYAAENLLDNYEDIWRAALADEASKIASSTEKSAR